jgi:type IV secretion system protein TrbJ
VDEFKAVQEDVYARRTKLKAAIATTSDALLGAESEAEEEKFDAVLNEEYSQLIWSK